MVQKLQGIYNTVSDTLEALHRLKKEGYERHHITVLTNKTVAQQLPWNTEGDIELAGLDEEEHPDFFDRVKSLFVSSKDDYESHHSDQLLEVREKYKSELEEGKLVILLNKDAHKAHETENELDKERSPLSTAGAQDYERQGYQSQKDQ